MRPAPSTISADSSATPLPHISVAECPREFRAAALRTLHDGLPSDQRSVLTQVLSQLDPADEAAWAGLLVAADDPIPPPSKGGDGGGISDFAKVTTSEVLQRSPIPPLTPPFEGGRYGVIWVQRAAGNTAVVWATPEVGDISAALLRAAAAFVDAQGIPLAQMIVGEREGYSEAQNERGGFPKFAVLQYLFTDVPRLSVANDLSDEDRTLQFVSRAGDEPQRLGELLEQTYVGTLDCPGLDGIRPMGDVLDGYRRQGRHAPDDWYFVQQNGCDVGALLLAEHPGYGNWELVYMGVIPAARGHKLGDAIIRFALDVAARRGAERLVLAVDEHNAPAAGAYERAGFTAWDRRLVYARLRTPSQHSANVALPQL